MTRASTARQTPWHAVIMAGGLGERLWPLTGAQLPKPLVPLRRGGTLLSATVERMQPLVPLERIWVVTSAAYRSAVTAALPAALRPRIVAEPAVRGTATCIAVMAHLIAAADPTAGLFILPSDHWVSSTAQWQKTLRAAAGRCTTEPEALVCVGMPPTRLSSGYGYLHCAGGRVTRFAEKPSVAQANTWIAQGNVLWNGGIFTGWVRTFQEAFQRWVPDVAAAVARLPKTPGGGLERALARLYPSWPSRSFDREVLEHHLSVGVVRATFDWSDVGTWAAWPVLQRIVDVRRVGLEYATFQDNRQPIWLGDAAVVGSPGTIAIRTKQGLLVCGADDMEHVRPPRA